MTGSKEGGRKAALFTIVPSMTIGMNVSLRGTASRRRGGTKQSLTNLATGGYELPTVIYGGSIT